jgi:hypothetical protein
MIGPRYCKISPGGPNMTGNKERGLEPARILLYRNAGVSARRHR